MYGLQTFSGVTVNGSKVRAVLLCCTCDLPAKAAVLTIQWLLGMGQVDLAESDENGNENERGNGKENGSGRQDKDTRRGLIRTSRDTR